MDTIIEEVSSSSKFNWKIEKFSKLNAQDGSYSPVFSVGNYKWKARIHPKGKKEVYDHLTLFLYPVDLKKSVNTEISFAVTSQTDLNKRVQMEGKYKFSAKRGGVSFGWRKFMPLSELHDPANGYIVNDTCVITIEITCRMKEESNADVKERDSEMKVVSEYKPYKIKDERQ